MTGYTRQSAADIVPGEDVLSGPLNDEFNQLEDTFNGTNGHTHDGTIGNGPKINLSSSVIGVLASSNIADNSITTAKIVDANVTSAKLASGAAISNISNNSIVKAKLEQLSNFTVLGNVSGALGNVTEVSILNDSTMSANSSTAIPTQQSVKGYVDSTAFNSALPNQTGNSGKFIVTDGTNASWTNISQVPSQTGSSGLFLQTDGTNASWVSPYPTQASNSGKYLTTDGTNPSWATIIPDGQRTFTATGTLPNGATVVLNSDGTVSAVTGNNDTLGTATVFRSATTTYIASAALSATQVVVCYYDGSGGQAVIGTISGTGIIFGTAVTFTASEAATYISVCALSSTSFAVVWRGNDTYGKARVGSVSGTTISFPTAAVNFNTASTSFISIAALSSTAVVIAYQDTGNSNYGTAIIGTISGTTISFPGSEYVFRSATTDAVSVTTLSSSSFVVSLNASGEPAGRVYVGSVSGTAISYGSSVVFDSTASPSYTSIVALTSTTFMVAWARSTTDGRAKIGTVSGTTVSFTGASDVVFNAGNTTYISAVKLSPTQVAVAYADAGNSSYGTLAIGTVSGLGITFDSDIIYLSAAANYTGSCAIGSNVFIGFRNGNSFYGTGVVFQPAATDAAGWLGIAAASAASGASVPVTLLGGVNASQTGLTTATTYYLANNGTLTTTQTSYKVGRALSGTEILITGAAQ